MWFAFILLSLSYWKQRCMPMWPNSGSCDLLSFYYLCRTGNNQHFIASNFIQVVICFHFTIFVVLETTTHSRTRVVTLLWFAFILLSLSYWKQPLYWKEQENPSCDLLSFYYLCRTGNNERALFQSQATVVICFHFTIFVVLETTTDISTSSYYMLWFAFILLSLSYWKQPNHAKHSLGRSCDLLSFYYLCRTGNNNSLDMITKLTLWFAFILLSLSYWKQRQISPNHWFSCCDLLSFYYLCRTGNNERALFQSQATVVICFHFTIFVVLETTRAKLIRILCPLWFAFILLSLSYWKQHTFLSSSLKAGCDLLSFYYLCRTGNNMANVMNMKQVVVICFHFTIFVVLETTGGAITAGVSALWFAFILLSLSYWKQLSGNARVYGNGCDLLSFYYLCRTGNNVTCYYAFFVSVVICFHFTIFVVLETTFWSIQA